jgi:hypothetical protein
MQAVLITQVRREQTRDQEFALHKDGTRLSDLSKGLLVNSEIIWNIFL